MLLNLIRRLVVINGINKIKRSRTYFGDTKFLLIRASFMFPKSLVVTRNPCPYCLWCYCTMFGTRLVLWLMVTLLIHQLTVFIWALFLYGVFECFFSFWNLKIYPPGPLTLGMRIWKHTLQRSLLFVLNQNLAIKKRPSFLSARHSIY